jgi:hypothetical protein
MLDSASLTLVGRVLLGFPCRKKRRLAEELRSASVEADNKAHDVSRQVPHGMVQ